MSEDINISKSYSKKDSNLRGSKSSFQDVANDILNTDSQVKEGKIPTGTQQSKRRTIVGVKPEGLMNSTQISRKSLRDEVPIGQVSDNVNIVRALQCVYDENSFARKLKIFFIK